MKAKHFSFMMKFIIIALAVFGAVFYALVPNLVGFMAELLHFTAHGVFYPWTTVILLTAIDFIFLQANSPCYFIASMLQ